MIIIAHRGNINGINSTNHNVTKIWDAIEDGFYVELDLWRIKDNIDMRAIIELLPMGLASHTHVDETDWIRHVAANPNADMNCITAAIGKTLREVS